MKHTPGPSVISEARSTKVDLINTRTGIDAVHRTRDNVVKTPVVVEGILQLGRTLMTPEQTEQLAAQAELRDANKQAMQAISKATGGAA